MLDIVHCVGVAQLEGLFQAQLLIIKEYDYLKGWSTLDSIMIMLTNVLCTHQYVPMWRGKREKERGRERGGMEREKIEPPASISCP